MKSINTPAGIIKGRDGIYLDQIDQSFYPSTLLFTGDINGALCDKNTNKKEWIPYKLKFLNVIAYECQELDSCYWEKDILSCFDESLVPFFEGNTNYDAQYRYFYLSTYDYMFKIVAKNFEIEVDQD